MGEAFLCSLLSLQKCSNFLCSKKNCYRKYCYKTVATFRVAKNIATVKTATLYILHV
jgi:hypothetical protein